MGACRKEYIGVYIYIHIGLGFINLRVWGSKSKKTAYIGPESL